MLSCCAKSSHKFFPLVWKKTYCWITHYLSKRVHLLPGESTIMIYEFKLRPWKIFFFKKVITREYLETVELIINLQNFTYSSCLCPEKKKAISCRAPCTKCYCAVIRNPYLRFTVINRPKGDVSLHTLSQKSTKVIWSCSLLCFVKLFVTN